MERDSSGSRSLVRSGVGTGEFGAAGLSLGREFHEFNTSVVGIVEIELPFAVAAELGLLAGLPTVFEELRFCRLNVGNTESDVVHHAESMFVGGWGNIEHVFHPVCAVGNLHGDPACFVVLHAAMPVRAEAENVFVKAVHGGAVVDDEAGVYKPISGIC